jgi:RNA polymerase sigma factor (sigma-70 family)
MTRQRELSNLFESLRDSLGHYVRRMVPSRDVEDVVQETFLKFCKADADQEIRSPRSFMFKTAKNLALDYVKRAEHRLTDSLSADEDHLGLSDLSTSQGLSDQLATERELSAFSDALIRLPAKCRQAFVLRKVYGYTHKEIASLMSISEKTVEKHIALGIRRTTEYLFERSYFAPAKGKPADVHPITEASRGGRS